MTSASSPKRRWWGVIALAFSAFIFNTSEFVPVGLLHAIGASFDMPANDVGLMLTLYAWAVALLSLPGMLLTGQAERRKLLTLVFVLFIASHVLAGVAWSFPVLLLGRLGIAGAHAIFWSISVALAVRMAPEGRKGLALGLIATGTSMAMVLGIPLGRVVGEVLGWRTTFLAIAVVASLILAVLRATLPELPSQNAGSLASLPSLFRRPTLVLLYVLTAVAISAHFTAYTYIEPFVYQVAKLGDNAVTAMLLLFGIAGIPGAMFFNRHYARQPKRFLLATVAVLTACLLTLRPSAASPAVLSMHALLWGAAIICFNLAMQAWILRLASDATDLAMSLFSGIYNIGIGTGALLGNLIANHVSVAYVGWFGGSLGLVSVCVCWMAFQVRMDAPPRMSSPTV
ncbi:MAG TPA: sugar transporter [Bordetella sp.]